MEETIDLRPYVEALLRRWWVILGAVVAGILVAVLLQFIQTDYQATALVAVTEPTQQLQFDERIVNTADLNVLLPAYPELATSDEVLSLLAERAAAMTDGEIAYLPELRNMLHAEKGADPRLVRLTARADDPQLAADLANAWAEEFVTFVKAIHQVSGGNVEFFTTQLAETNSELQAAERALVDFQSGSRMGIVDNELLSLTTLQATYLSDQRRLNLALDDIRALHRQIAAGQGDAIPWADQLTALMLQIRVYESVVPTPEAASALQLQFNSSQELTTDQRAAQLQMLDELAQSAEQSRSEIDVKLLGLEAPIFELQREKQDLFHQFEELTRNRDVAKETYLSLARKIAEVRIQSEDTGSGVKTISPAAVPLSPERVSLFISAAIAGLAGLLLSALVILLLDWWKKSADRPVAQ